MKQMMETSHERKDLILSQGTHAFIQEGASGSIFVVVGPHKESIGEMDRAVVYNSRSKKFVVVNSSEALQSNVIANEEQYVVLKNPVESNDKKYPIKGRQYGEALTKGSKINISGPISFALFPEQQAEVIDGHQLKSNEFLFVRVYNAKAALANLENLVLVKNKSDETDPENKEEAKKNKSKLDFTVISDDITTGQLIVIKGSDVSFFIPPTGIEVLKINDTYVQNAVTLERLEYSILLDENGDKRYVKGPAVVYPKPTEHFVEKNKMRKFRAIELNQNMGIYIKVIENYEDDDEKKTKHAIGDELFITGETQKIYFPRDEHSIIKYGDDIITYAITVPVGEGRYVLDKNNGKIDLIKGEKMLLLDPRRYVVVQRKLGDRTVGLWFPGNVEAQAFNAKLAKVEGGVGYSGFSGYSGGGGAAGADYATHSKSMVRGAADIAGEMMSRKTKFTKPRSITIDSKFEGAVNISVWPGYAVQVIKKTGERKVVIGPKNILLEYDEILEVLELSTGKPKHDHDLMRTAYLQIHNNNVSDIITVETKDLISVDVRLSYRINFDEKHKEKWFSVSNYVKLLTQHLRSILRNAIKSFDIEEFNSNAADIIRDTILGKMDDKIQKRKGKFFEENGMSIYDVEVLNTNINNDEVYDMLNSNQLDTIEKNLKEKKLERKMDLKKKEEEYARNIITVEMATSAKQNEKKLAEMNQESKTFEKKKLNEAINQEVINLRHTEEIKRQKELSDHDLEVKEKESTLKILESKGILGAIQPGLVEAIISLSSVNVTDTLAKNLKQQTSGLGTLFSNGGFENLLATVEGTPIHDKLLELFEKFKTIKLDK